MKLGSLCTGYGGLDLALGQLLDVDLAWYSEFDKNPSKIMEKNYPNVENLKDLTVMDWENLEPVDVLSAGYPCQPFSGAGKRKGADDPRHLWPYIAKGISVLRPRIIILENVRGHLNLGFAEVLRDLAGLGYDAEWEIIRASDIGAPHKRERLFIVAHGEGSRRERSDNQSSKPQTTSSRFTFKGTAPLATNANNGSDRQVPWGRYQDSITNWERLTRPSPEPITNARLNPVFVEWLMGLPEGWVTDTDITDNAKLKALGNGVVPQQAALAISRLLNR